MIIFGLTDDHYHGAFFVHVSRPIAWLLTRACDTLAVCNVLPRRIVVRVSFCYATRDEMRDREDLSAEIIHRCCVGEKP